MKKTYQVKFSIDDTKAFKVGERLLDQFYTRKGLFAGYSMPEYISPRNLKEGTKEHAQYLTYVIAIDYMTNAEKLWKHSRGAYELHPERFTPQKILGASPQSVETFVRHLGARFYSNAASIWRGISKVLIDSYDGDPRNITKDPQEIATVKKRLKDFPSLRGLLRSACAK